jgi:thiamine-phosphate pyrophosphorylase
VNLPDPPLLIITDRRQAAKPLPDVLDAVFATGCRWASVREKDLSAADQFTLTRTLLPVAQRWGARLTLHGDAAMAKAAGVDGVHLPAGSDAAAARSTLGPESLIGISIHSLEEAAKLDPAALDYGISGPVFATDSKPGYGPTLGTSGFAAIAKVTSVPMIAIGGIRMDQVPELVRAGAAGIAVMGGIMRAADPGAEVQRLIAILKASR